MKIADETVLCDSQQVRETFSQQNFSKKWNIMMNSKDFHDFFDKDKVEGEYLKNGP